MRPLLNSLFPDRQKKERKTYGYVPERKTGSGSRSDDHSFPLTGKTATSANEISIHGGRDNGSASDMEVPRTVDLEAGKQHTDEKRPSEGINVKKEFRIQHF